MRNLQIAVAMKVKLNREVRFLREGHELYPIFMETQTLCGVDVNEASDLVVNQGYRVCSFKDVQQDIHEYAVYWLSIIVVFEAILIFIFANLNHSLCVLGAEAILLLVGLVLIYICVHVYYNGCTDIKGTRVLLRDGIIISARGTQFVPTVGTSNVTGDAVNKID